MRKFLSCLTLLFFLCAISSCGLKMNDADEAVVIYTSEEEGQTSAEPADANSETETAEETAEPNDNETDTNSETEINEEEESEEPESTDTVSETESGEEEPIETEPPDAELSGSELINSLTNSGGEDENSQEIIAEPERVASGEVIDKPERVAEPIDVSALSNEPYGWYYNRNYDHVPPTGETRVDLERYDAHFLGDISKKTVYLTFDEGYENGFTSQILDVLKEKNVQAAFFLTGDYIRSEPELSQRIAAEGHVPANHSDNHPSFPTITDEEITAELNGASQLFADTTGYPMDPFFRPPAGEFSERSLAVTKGLGYTTVFWSFAHVDWLLAEQPAPEDAYNKVMNELHSGMIILLHAVSEANTNALPDIIDGIRAQGYEFGSLHDLRD